MSESERVPMGALVRLVSHHRSPAVCLCGQCVSLRLPMSACIYLGSLSVSLASHTQVPGLPLPSTDRL